MSTFDYCLITLPIFGWYIVRAIGKDFAREFCSVFKSVVFTRAYSSGRVRLKENEENALLKIIKQHTKKSLRELQQCTVEFTPQKGMWWYFGGSAMILCTVQAPGEPQKEAILLKVRYKQQLRVKPWLIVEIAAADVP